MIKNVTEWCDEVDCLSTYQAWNAAMPDHKTTKVALTTRFNRIRIGQGPSRLNLVEPDSRGVATLTGTLEEGVVPGTGGASPSSGWD